MAITYPITLPGPNPARIRWLPVNVVGVSESEFTLEQEVFEWPGKALTCEVTMPRMVKAQAAEFAAALLSLNGRAGTFLLGDPLRVTPRGSAAGTPVVDGSHDAGSKTLAVRGWTPSQTGVLQRLDCVQVGSGTSQRFHYVLVDADADGIGKVTLDIWPTLRESLSDGAAIVTSDCKGVFMLASDAGWDVDAPFKVTATFRAVEAL